MIPQEYNQQQLYSSFKQKKSNRPTNSSSSFVADFQFFGAGVSILPAQTVRLSKGNSSQN